MQRPGVSVQTFVAGAQPSTIELPCVFKSPIRSDIVNTVHANLAKNHRQAYAVSRYAGAQTSAESWGTGRAVARIPRVAGGGTHRSGQGAFGNMCRGGRMFAPTKVWRRWHRRVNKNQRRFAVCSALAASAVTSLVMARGHRVNEVPQIPLVVGSADLATFEKNGSKTKEATKILAAIKADGDVNRVKHSRAIRAGSGKSRNRRFVQRRGPLVVIAKGEEKVGRAFRNIAGVEVALVSRLNLLQLAPGGHVGRFIIWTQAAFSALNDIFKAKSGFVYPRAVVSHADLGRIINSPEVQSHLRSKKRNVRATHKRNPLTNNAALIHLNPYAESLKRRAIKEQNAIVAARDAKVAAIRAAKAPAAAERVAVKASRANAHKLRKARSEVLNMLFQ